MIDTFFTILFEAIFEFISNVIAFFDWTHFKKEK